MVATDTKNRYDELISLGNDLNNLVRLGLISCHLLDWKLYYESYLLELVSNDPSVAVTRISDQYGISERQMYRIIKYMKTN